MEVANAIRVMMTVFWEGVSVVKGLNFKKKNRENQLSIIKYTFEFPLIRGVLNNKDLIFRKQKINLGRYHAGIKIPNYFYKCEA